MSEFGSDEWFADQRQAQADRYTEIRDRLLGSLNGGPRERMSRDEFAQMAFDALRVALDNDLLTNDEMREIIKILQPVAERAKHGGPSAAQIERN